MIDRILDLIKERGVTAQRLSQELGLSNSAVSDWKKGKGKPSADTIIKLSEYFDVTADYLLGRTNDPTPPKIQPVTIPSALEGVRFALYGDIHELDQEELEELGRMATRMRELKELKKKNSSASGTG